MMGDRRNIKSNLKNNFNDVGSDIFSPSIANTTEEAFYRNKSPSVLK
jgi:hypothetical protein